MPEVEIQIAGRTYRLGCGEGEEAHLRGLAARLDSEAQRLTESMGQVSESRLMLMCALLMADKLSEAEAKPKPEPDPQQEAALAARLDGLTDRLEQLVARLDPGSG